MSLEVIITNATITKIISRKKVTVAAMLQPSAILLYLVPASLSPIRNLFLLYKMYISAYTYSYSVISSLLGLNKYMQEMHRTIQAM